MPPFTPETLRRPHASLTRNPRLCEALFLARYIEKYGTGTLMMIRESRQHALPEPDFGQPDGEFVVTLWRDRLTEQVLAGLGLNERQLKAVAFLKTNQRISNPDYQRATGTTKKTATRDLFDLRIRGIVEQRGARGPGVHYVLAGKGDRMGTMGTSAEVSLKSGSKPAKPATRGQIQRPARFAKAPASRRKGDKIGSNETSVQPVSGAGKQPAGKRKRGAP